MWTVQQDGDVITLDERDTRSGVDKPNLSINEGVLVDGQEYRFR